MNIIRDSEFSKFAWYAMLLSTGMGIGLLFWSVAEPITYLGSHSPFLKESFQIHS